MEHIISVINHKGGVGKTTSAVNVAACLGEMNQQVLLIDIDPQGNATTSLGVENTGDDLLQAMQKSDALPVIATGAKGFDLVPSGPALVAARQRFSGVVGAELLRRCLQRTNGGWQWVLIDCPPSMGILTLNALLVSRHVLVPVEASYLGLQGLGQIVETVDSVRRQHSARARIEAVIPCRAHVRRKMHQEIMVKLARAFPQAVTPVIRENVALAEAPGHGKPVISYAPRSNGAHDYRQATQWLFQHLSTLNM